MIYIKDKDDTTVVPNRKKFQIPYDKEETIELARDYFRNNPEIRDEAIEVMDLDTMERKCWLCWKTNINTDIPDRMLNMVNAYVNELWDYQYYDDRMDFDILERAEVFLFDTIEEYTYAIAKILLAYFPDKYIFFKDKRALWFFDESDHFKVIDSEADIFNHYYFILQKSIMSVRSEVLQFGSDARDPLNYVTKKYASTEIIVGLYWLTDEMNFGDKNPEKTFFLIKSPLTVMGLSDLIRWTLYRVKVAEDHRRGKIIPIVDMSVEGDNNQFNGGDGTNAWTMFFEQLTDIPIAEVYQSKNVIRGADQLFMANPYIKEESMFPDHAALFRKYLRFNEKTQNYVDALYDKVIPKDKKRILGVIGRGTDYNLDLANLLVNKPSGPAAFLKRVEQVVQEGDYDCVFLATEDANVYKQFMESALAPKIVYVDQERIDYNDKDNSSRFLIEIYNEQKRDGYQATVQYLGIIHILSKCTSMIASVDCGAYHIAMGLNDHRYEYSEVYMKKDEG